MVIYNISPLWFHKGDGISDVALNLHVSLNQIGCQSFLLQINAKKSNSLPKNNTALMSKVDKSVKEFSFIKIIINSIFNKKKEGASYILHGIFQVKLILVALFLIFARQDFLIVPHSSLNRSNFNSFSFLKKLIFKVLVCSILKKAKRVVFLNENEKGNSAYRGGNYTLINNGIVVERKLCQNISNSNVFNLCFLGRYDIKHKGIDRLFDFLLFLKLNYPNFKWHLNMCGSDSKNGKDKLYSLLNTYSLNDYVTINGPVFGEDKEKFLENCDLFVLTSRYEGMPIAVLEALSYGKLCLLSNETNMLESLNEKGFAIEFCSQDHDKVAKKIISYSKMPLKQRYETSELIHNYAKSHFSWNKVARKYRDAFKVGV